MDGVEELKPTIGELIYLETNDGGHRHLRAGDNSVFGNRLGIRFKAGEEQQFFVRTDRVDECGYPVFVREETE
mgnify:CR=1 FL=1